MLIFNGSTLRSSLEPTLIHLENIIVQTQQQLEQPEKRTEKIEAQAKKYSQNSGKPPYSDSAFTKKKNINKKSEHKHCGRKGDKGNQQQKLEPPPVDNIVPQDCDFERLV